MTKFPEPRKYMNGDYCPVRANVITVKDCIARKCATCPMARRR